MEQDVSKNRIGLLLGVLITASAATWLVWRSDPGALGEDIKMASEPPAPESSTPLAGLSDVWRTPPFEKPLKVDSSGATGAALSMRQQFLVANDYKAFIAGILRQADAGDADAQYYMSAALTYCDKEFRALFKRRTGSGWLTLDEALSRAAGRREQSIEIVGEVDRKCRKLMEGGHNEFGDSTKWLQRAANGGQPVALAAVAESQLIEKLVGTTGKEPPKTGGAIDSMSTRDLLIAALKTKEPEVLWKIGELQGLLSGKSKASTKAQWAWWLAACERGYECGPTNQWLEFSCRFDQLCLQGETAVDYMKRTLQTDFAAVEEQAHEINSRIDAEAWSELEIGG